MAEIGSTLRDARMRERIDITTVEAATKIRAKYLRALENEEWDLLPGPTFVRTFLRTYGDYLGLDSKNLVEEYKQRFERPGPQDMPPFSSSRSGPSSGRRQRPPRAVPPWAIVGVCVVLLLGALYALGQLGEDTGGPGEVAATATPAPTAKPAKRGGRSRRRPSRKPAAPAVVSMRIIPEATVNVCLVDVKGTPLIRSQNLEEATKAYRSRRLKVTFGNGQVRMRVNGKSYPVPDTTQAVGFDLRPGKTPKPLAQDALPTCT